MACYSDLLRGLKVPPLNSLDYYDEDYEDYNVNNYLKTKIINIITKYHSSIIKSIDLIGALDFTIHYIDGESQELIVCIVNNESCILHTNLHELRCGIDKLLYALNKIGKNHKLDFEYTRKLKKIYEMSKVITIKILNDYLMEIMDDKLVTMNFDVHNGWEVIISNINISNFRDNMIIDDKYIEIIDCLISTTKRLKDLFDITMGYRFDNKKLIIKITANDVDGKIISF